MLLKSHINHLKKLVHGNLECNVSMKNHTSFRIGGKAKVILFPREIPELIDAITYLKKSKIKYYVFGLGSNLLVSDNDIDYVLIKLGSNFNHITVKGDTIIAYSGASINSICMAGLNNGLMGMEDAFGIPGTIGGAVIMNASAFNFETKDVVKSVVALINGKIDIITDFKFGYRKSIFQEFDDVVILQVEIKLKHGVKSDIKSRMDEIINKRKLSQPLDYPSAGSVFKRLDDMIVSQKIDELNLKGLSVNNAVVSLKHAGFIINTGGATAKDVVTLINIVKQKFKEKYNKDLEVEIKFLGDKDDFEW